MSALRPAFFILYLESFISRLNEILCHDLTLSVGEPDNAAAKQGQELRSEQTAINIQKGMRTPVWNRIPSISPRSWRAGSV